MPSKRVLFRSIAVLFLTTGSIWTLACGQQNTHRENLGAQHLADSQAKFDELAPAEANFVGKMHLLKSGQEFEVVLKLQRILENARSSQSPDPTDTVELPKLSGNMRFPAIEHIETSEFADYAELLNPLGGFATALFDFGDYNPKTHFMILPYTVPTYNQGNFGELTGQLEGDRFSGFWFSKPFGKVASFELHKQSSSVTRAGST